MNAMQTGEMMVQSHYQSNPTDGVTLIISGKLLYCRENCRRITKATQNKFLVSHPFKSEKVMRACVLQFYILLFLYMLS